MAMVRTTVVLDDIQLQLLRNLFGGNVSRGLSKVVDFYLERNDPMKKAFGSLKGWKIDSQKVKDELRKEWGD